MSKIAREETQKPQNKRDRIATASKKCATRTDKLEEVYRSLYRISGILGEIK